MLNIRSEALKQEVYDERRMDYFIGGRLPFGLCSFIHVPHVRAGL